MNKKLAIPPQLATVNVVEMASNKENANNFQFIFLFLSRKFKESEKISIVKKKDIIPIDSWSENPAIVL